MRPLNLQLNQLPTPDKSEGTSPDCNLHQFKSTQYSISGVLPLCTMKIFSITILI